MQTQFSPTTYEQHLRAAVLRQIERLPQVSRSEVSIECEFPKSLLLVKLHYARLPGRILGNYSSIWEDNGAPIHSADPEQRADFVAQILHQQIEDLNLDALPPPKEDGIIWI